MGALAAVMMLLAAGVLAAGAVGVKRVLAEPPAPTVEIHTAATLTPVLAAGRPVAAPAQGSLALVATGPHLARTPVVEQQASTVRQIGSVAKVMTALVTLESRPLAVGESGPGYTMDATDVSYYTGDLAAGGSVVPVSRGEVFTERQLLLALLLPSGNNIAETLARWVGGTRSAFVSSLNARARALGMAHTTFADPSGFDDGTVSTADDLVILGAAALAVPALADVVKTTGATLPDGTSITNLDSLLTTEPGWLGIKTGSTNAAGGCLLFAASRPATGAAAGDAAHSVTLVGAVLGQPQLQDAITAAAAVVNSAAAEFAVVDPARLRPDVTGSVNASWGAATTVTLGQGATGDLLVLRAGQTLALSTSTRRLSTPVASGTRVGTVTATLDGTAVATWPVVTTATVEGPGLGWRLENN